MSKIIINNQSDLSDYEAVNIAISVIRLGRISENHTSYCLGSLFEVNNIKYVVYTKSNKKSDTFTVRNSYR